jgi:hypothetical protein
MMSSDVRITLGLEADKSSIKKTGKEIEKGLTAPAKKAQKAFKAAAGEGTKLNKQLGKKQGKIQIEQSAIAMGELAQQTANANKQAIDLDQNFSDVSKSVAAFGDVESAARTGGGAIGAVGAVGGVGDVAGEVEGAIAAFSEIPAVIEALPKLGASVGQVGVKFLTMTGIMAPLTVEAAAASSGIFGMSVATATLVAVAIPLIVAGAALAAAFFFLKKRSDDATKAAEAYSETIEAQADTYAEVNQALKAGDVESVAASYVDLQKQAQEAADRQRFLATQAAQETGKRRKELNEAANEAAAEFENLTGQMATVEATANSYGIALEDLDLRTEATKEAEEELITERDRASAAIDDLSAQESKLIADRGKKLDKAAEDQALKDQRAAEDLSELRAKEAEKLSQISTDGQKKLAATAQEGIEARDKAIADGATATTEAIADFAKEQSKIRDEFAEKDLERQRKHEEAKAKALQSFQNAEFDAILANDIIGAMRAERAFEQEEAQRESEFTRTQEQERNAAKERLDLLRQEQQQKLNEIAANTKAEILAAKEATRVKIAAENQALQTSLDNEKKAQAEAEKQRKKRERRAEEDRAIREKREREAFEEQLKAIQDKKRAEQQALQAVTDTLAQTATASIDAAGQAAQAMINAVGETGQAAINSMVNAINQLNPGGGGARSRQSGGAVTAGNLFKVNDGASQRTEFFRPNVDGRIIPLAGRDQPRSSGGGNTIVFKNDITVGDIASQSDVVTGVRSAMIQFAQQDLKATADAIAGV